MKKIFQITLKTLQLYYIAALYIHYKNEIDKRILLFILVHVLHYIIVIIFHLYYILFLFILFFFIFYFIILLTN